MEFERMIAEKAIQVLRERDLAAAETMEGELRDLLYISPYGEVSWRIISKLLLDYFEGKLEEE